VQFVRSVGDKHFPHPENLFQALQHLIKGMGQPGNFVFAFTFNYQGIQVTGRNIFYLFFYLRNKRQGPADIYPSLYK
jgi:hypothetical protein